MKVLVIGGRGQLARSLVERSRKDQEIDLVAIGRPVIDLERQETILPAVRASAPDLVINAAAFTAVDLAEDEPERAFFINAAGAAEVARAAAAIGVPVVQISTDYVFDGERSEPYHEDDAVNPINVYGRSKLEGERLVRVANADHLIVRTAWVYSPFAGNFVKTMLRLATARDEVSVVDDQRGSPTSALDLADALLVLAKRVRNGQTGALGRTLHLTGSQVCSWLDFAELIFQGSAAAGGPSVVVRAIPTVAFPTKALRPSNSVLDNHAFSSTFGFSLPPVRSSLPEVLRRILRKGGGDE